MPKVPPKRYRRKIVSIAPALDSQRDDDGQPVHLWGLDEFGGLWKLVETEPGLERWEYAAPSPSLIADEHWYDGGA